MLLEAIDELPPLPRILDRVLQVLDDGNSSCSQVAALIDKDSVLSGNVLRCVNSAYYGLPATVTSIRHAVSLLGLATIRNQALAFFLRRLIKSSHQPPARLYGRYAQHSLACGLLAHHLAERSGVDNAEAAFATGLFHDIGKLLILSTFPAFLMRLVERYEEGDVSWEQAEEEIVGLAHPQVSALVLEKWKLPAFMQRAVEFHHRPGEFAGANGALSLAKVVHASDLYASESGVEILPTRRRREDSAEAALQNLGMGEKLPAVLERFQIEYDSLRGLF